MHMRHPAYIVGCSTTIEEFAINVAEMPFDKTSFFISRLADNLEWQAHNDAFRGRKLLSDRLYETRDCCNEIADSMKSIWKAYRFNEEKLPYIVGCTCMIEEIAPQVGNMRYDALRDYLGAQGEAILTLSKDEQGKLKEHLRYCGECFDNAKEEMDKAWKICEPYMI